MAQNYNINSSFGFNVTPKSAGANNQNTEIDLFKQTSESLENSNNFFSKYENVFNGNIEKEIDMYSRQMMFVGMSLKASDNTIRRFDMSI